MAAEDGLPLACSGGYVALFTLLVCSAPAVIPPIRRSLKTHHCHR